MMTTAEENQLHGNIRVQVAHPGGRVSSRHRSSSSLANVALGPVSEVECASQRAHYALGQYH